MESKGEKWMNEWDIKLKGMKMINMTKKDKEVTNCVHIDCLLKYNLSQTGSVFFPLLTHPASGSSVGNLPAPTHPTPNYPSLTLLPSIHPSKLNMESVTESFFCHPHSSSFSHSSSSLTYVTSALFSCAVTSDLSSEDPRESAWEEDEVEEELLHVLDVHRSILSSSLPREESLQSDSITVDHSSSHQDLPQSVSDESHEEEDTDCAEEGEEASSSGEEADQEERLEEAGTTDQAHLLNLSNLLNSIHHTTPMKHLRNVLDPLMDLLPPSATTTSTTNPPVHGNRQSPLGASSPTNHIENNSLNKESLGEDQDRHPSDEPIRIADEDLTRGKTFTELMGKNTRPFACTTRNPLGDISNHINSNQSCKIYKRQNFAHWSRRDADDLFEEQEESLFRGGEGILSKIPSLYLRRSTTEYSECNYSNFDIMSLCGKEAIVQMKSIFPCFDSPRDAIKRLSPATLTEILSGKYSSSFSKLHIIDCRYPYEYEGGHLPGAINISSLEEINNLLFSQTSLSEPTHETVLIFHCEFSSERAPRTALHVRNLDRFMNSANYPYLHYPQVYILDGGYKNFFVQYPQLCDPPNCYIPMRNVIFKEELKKCQKTRYMDASSHSKHRHKIRAAPSLKRSYSVSTSCPSSTLTGNNQRLCEYRRPTLPSYLNLAEMLSSDASGEIFDQKDKFDAAGDDFFSSQPISPS